MKRSKFEERSMGPMFPRLHVNDTEKGGPRAPPRNKMALYEQLTIPSNRNNPENMHLNPNSGASQGTSNDRVVYFPSYQPPVTRPLPSHSADRLQRRPSDSVNLRSLASQAERRRKAEDEDDFAVPIFSHPGKDQSKVAHHRRNDEGRCRAFSSSCSLRLPNTCNKETDQADSESLSLRQDRKDQDNEQTTVIVSSSDPKIRESSDGAMQLQEDAVMGDHLGMNRTSGFKYTNVDHRYSGSCGPIKEAEVRISSRLKSNSSFRPSNRHEMDCEDEGNQRGDSLLGENMDIGHDVSRTSNVATISDLDVSPDAVVNVIGLKHFWKARRAIVNQQRAFAVQVFELHRLMKVQQLIAESPEILIDASTFLGQSSIKVTPLKNIPSDYTLKALADSNKPKDNSQKPNLNSNNNNNKIEGTLENAVVESPIPSPPTPNHSLNHPQFPPNPALQIPAPPPPMAIPQAGGGHQWLVPIMSPSEGLIYKPYPGLAFPAGPVCGGCRPHGPTPHPTHHHFMPSPYYPHPGATPFNVQGYFPPYGMSGINSAVSGSAVDQINGRNRGGSNPNGETGQTVIRMPNFSVQQQGSCTKPGQRHSELLGSTGSSPSARAQDIVRCHPVRKEKDALTLNPRAPTKHQPCETEQPSTVIKVVPHNARTATESAARIFRSIQEERRQNQPN